MTLPRVGDMEEAQKMLRREHTKPQRIHRGFCMHFVFFVKPPIGLDIDTHAAQLVPVI